MGNILSKKEFNEIRGFIYKNARPLEFNLWKYHFENGSLTDVLSTLEGYQNEDGGFGQIIEPDNWNPESSPYNTEYAISILRQINFFDISHPIYEGIFRYLENTKYQGENGWFFTIPSTEAFPHAIWWNYNEEENVNSQYIGITADLAGFIQRYGNKDSSLYKKAEVYTKKLFDRLAASTDYGDMGLLGFCSLYSDLFAAGLQDKYDLDFLKNMTTKLINEHFKEYVWTFHQDMSVVLPNPSIYYYEGKEQAVSDAIDELITIRHVNGVWDIPWEWYDNGKYVREFAISENWWKSIKAIEKVLFLRAYGRKE